MFFALGVVAPAHAHVGSKDVFEQVNTGPYNLYVTVRTPLVIPGVATVEVRSLGASIHAIRMTPVPLTGEASKHPPSSDPLQPSAADSAFFNGSLWLMASGPWQVRLQVDGAAGEATTGVPVPAMPLSVLPMQRSLGMILAFLGLILVVGVAGIVAAAVREARLAPGLAPTPSRRRRALVASGLTLLLMAAVLYLGNKWWSVEAAGYAEEIYKPSSLNVTLTGDTLALSISQYDPKKKRWNLDATDDFLLDHGHLMHLYAIREPAMDAAFHLHPAPTSAPDDDIRLATTLPAMPPGTYKLYGDIVYKNGFPETLTATLTVPPGLPAAPLAPEDASSLPPALAASDLGPAYKLPDGYTMVWDRPASISATTGYSFRFTLLDPSGHPAQDMQPYLGMAGHAAFVKTDGTTFAHTHPEGSAAMPDVMLAEAANGAPIAMADGAATMLGTAAAGALSPTVEFPYGFPTPGRYRIFIQMKHGSKVETGVFDAEAH
jgi:hypothetical protein